MSLDFKTALSLLSSHKKSGMELFERINRRITGYSSENGIISEISLVKVHQAGYPTAHEILMEFSGLTGLTGEKNKNSCTGRNNAFLYGNVINGVAFFLFKKELAERNSLEPPRLKFMNNMEKNLFDMIKDQQSFIRDVKSAYSDVVAIFGENHDLRLLDPGIDVQISSSKY
ncbi:MAG: hypothetical protein ACTSRU_08055, partial [Candidatus Hodarchaeales archaeon]